MSIKVLHTSDWHIGKKLFMKERYEEHEYFLNWLIDKVNTEKVDVLLMAGDIFDTFNPPFQAIKIFNHFLQKLNESIGIHAYFIVGNHDSGRLFESLYPLLPEKISIISSLKDDLFHKIKKDDLELSLLSLPFFRSYDFVQLEKESIDSEDDILNKIDHLFEKFENDFAKESDYNLLMAHHLFGNYMATGSEQFISLSGVESIPTSYLKKYFNAVYLGHIHRAQNLSRVHDEHPQKQIQIRYSGSPLPLRFSEQEQKKVFITNFTKDEMTEEEFIIEPMILLKQLKGSLDDIIGQIKSYESEKKTWFEIKLDVEAPMFGIVDELRENIENKNHELIHFEQIFQQDQEQEDVALEDLSLNDLFNTYYQEKYTEASPVWLNQYFSQLQERMEQENETP